MHIRLEIALLSVGGLIRIADIGSDVWYLLTHNFGSALLRAIFIASLLAPAFVLIALYSFTICADLLKGNSFSCFKLTTALLFILGDSVGLNYFVFSIILCCSNLYLGDFYIVDAMFRASSLINCLFQSTPQIALQIYNNMQFNNWSFLTIASISLSALSMVYTIAKLVYAVD